MFLTKVVVAGICCVLLVSFALPCAAQVSQALLTGDNVKLEADFYKAQQANSPTVILLPDTRCDRKAFGSFPAKLNKAGFNVLAIDLR